MTTSKTGRPLSAAFVLAATVGGVIGLGILRGPGEIAAVIREPSLYLGLWLLVGMFVLLSTAVCAELVGMTPRSGGIYPLIRHAYGPYPGFVIGWVDWLSFVADCALKSVVIVEFTAILFPAAADHATVIALSVVSFFATLQLRGVRLTSLIQEISTVGIGLVIVAFSITLFFFRADPPDPSTVAPVKSGLNDWSLVLATIVFTYDGWLYASYFSGEIKGGAGAVARSCIKAMVMVIALYMLLNWAMVHGVGLDAMADQSLALATALELAISPAASVLVTIAALVILLAHQNLLFMGAPRVLKALAEDGFAIRRAQRVGRGGNPVFAVIITWAVAVFLVLQGGFEFLLLLSVFFYIPLYLALILGVMILRRKEAERERPYRAWGHPYSTGFCLVAWLLITAFQAWVERETALYAVALVAISLPVYWFLKRHQRQAEDSEAPA